MDVITLPLGNLQTNCYLVSGDGCRCFVIDPGDWPEEVLHAVRENGLQIEAIVLTHGHFDHVGAVRVLAERTGCPVYLCPADCTMPAVMTAGPLYYTDILEEGDVLQLAGLEVQVLHTPGHTPGSVCLRTENTLFTGDTLFQSSCGRTDLPGGDWATITKSLHRLAQLPGNDRVYPGHGSATTLEQERKFNPYLQ